MNFLPPIAKQFFLSYLFLSVAFFSATAQRWERIFNEFPIEGECAFGIEATNDGGFLVVASRGFDMQAAQVTYLMKLDADGAIEWKHDVILGGAVKFCRLSGGNLAILSRHRSSPAVDYTFSYTVCTPTGTVVASHPIQADSMTNIKATFVTPIHSGLSAGGFAITCKGMLPGPYATTFVRTYDAAGEPKNAFPTYEANPDSFIIRSMVQGADQHFYGVGANFYPAQQDADAVWFKMGDNGHMESNWVKVFDDTSPGNHNTDIFHDIAPTNDGNLWVLLSRNAYQTGVNAQLFILKMTPAGDVIFNKFVAENTSNLDFAGLDRSKIVPLPDGGAAILFETYEDTEGGEDFSFARINANGNLIWTRHFGREKRFTESPFDLVSTADGGFALAGWFNDESFDSNDAYVVRTDSEGLVNTNYISGDVYADLNQNCQRDNNEPPLGAWMLRLERGGQVAFNTITDANGHYTLATDIGNATVRLIPPANYWNACADTVALSFSNLFDSTTVNFGVKPLATCPQLEVDVAAPFLRRCFEGKYTVTYSNRGTTAINNAVVDLALDPDLEFLSADAPFQWSGGNDFSFNVGNLPIGAFGSFGVRFRVSCDADLGQTHCTEANIAPSEYCENSSGWSGASVAVDGACKPDSVEFNIKNIGTADISTAVEYVIVEDEIIVRAGQIGNLPPGTSGVTIKAPANGSTWRLEATQEPGHPGNSQPSVAVEGCGTNNSGGSSTGYMTIFPEDDGDPFVSIDCQENIGSFDPNDKQGFPKGIDDEHFILPGTDIEYLIRFQNTGTDTAFTVILRDTLSDLLDLKTVRPGPSSHPYRFEIMGENVLKFSFPDILLPDSNVNEAASHGFLKFTVQHKPGIALGSVIRNTAAIYFDFNEPVITNETWHTVDTGFVKTSIVGTEQEPTNGLARLDIFPNPLRETGLVVLKSDSPDLKTSQNLRLRLRRADGTIAREQDFRGSQALFERQALPDGLYFVEIVENARILAVGKLVLQGKHR